MRIARARKTAALISLLLLAVAAPLSATQVGGPRLPTNPNLPPIQLEGVWEATVSWTQWDSKTGGYILMFHDYSAPTREGCEAQISNIGPGATITKFCTFRAY